MVLLGVRLGETANPSRIERASIDRGSRAWIFLGPALLFIAGRYEGIDERVIDAVVDEEVSLGDFVLSGGEFAAIAMIDAVVRLVPGVLGCAASADEDSFGESGLLAWPHYTRPESFEGRVVPKALLSGDHARIARWRNDRAEERTRARRPDLLDGSG